MKKLLLLIAFTAAYFNGFSQEYIYSFEGTNETQLLENFEVSLNKITGIQQCKVKMKGDSSKGQILIYLKKDVDPTDLSQQFTPIDIKSMILEYNFTPLQFIESK